MCRINDTEDLSNHKLMWLYSKSKAHSIHTCCYKMPVNYYNINSFLNYTIALLSMEQYPIQLSLKKKIKNRKTFF